MNPEYKNLDALLDKALTEYGVPVPRAGLENRILANLRIEQERRIRVRRCWTLGSAFALVAVVGAIWIASPAHVPRSPGGTSTVRATDRVESPAFSNRERTGTMQLGTANVHRRSAQRRLLTESAHNFQPKLSEFPAPRPLSEQERLLLAFIKAAPNPEVLAVMSQASNSSNLQIMDLEIPPLGNE